MLTVGIINDFLQTWHFPWKRIMTRTRGYKQRRRFNMVQI
ncbi:hypothetical protein HMPREF0602_0815 [Neisseria meningitidis ATCC 13091]|uniref:Uncharacterized protein n=2 Tax=Neisseria meningitidis TaxID=487 RepID=A0A0H5QSQ3_NEIMI|nr:hypothetical protein HMPREF0602_0815 [Neisseria meningitidis ATCC 13091]CRY98663.1 hypothetical protein [Neisseria meningitidis serogroup B]